MTSRVWIGGIVISLAALGACRPSPRRHPPSASSAAPAPPATSQPLAADSNAPGRRLTIVVDVDDKRRPLFNRAHARAVADSVPEIDWVIVPRDSVLAVIGTADAFIGSPNPAMIRAGSRLRWVQTQTGGVDEVLFPELRERPIVLTSAKIVKGPAMADQAMGLLLVLTRQLWRAVEARGHEQWPDDYEPIELHGRTALIVGLGGAGTQVAERAFASGMRVIATDPKDIPIMRAVDRVERPEHLAELLPLADVIFLTAPLTRQTYKLIGDREFGLMKRGVYLVNIARGPIVDTDALVRALQDGRVAGAGLDVVSPRPGPGHPLWRMKNVVMTPQMAGQSERGSEHRSRLIIENARRFADGLPLRNVADKELGY
ncbi:MAG TPA: D-2-hydroxyacid dehydrogenase [Gemmatimonadales bacterium]|nr:D-2-hydroxyacid dehydrogenase [Gemmatimonadales bacterium]